MVFRVRRALCWASPSTSMVQECCSRSEAADTVLYSPRTTILIVQNSEIGKKLESPLARDIQSPKYTFAESLIKITPNES